MGLPSNPMTAAGYLAWEREQLERHEFCRGDVFAMSGGSPRHNAISAAIVGDLRVATRGSSCRVLSSDQRVVVFPGEHYVYPDVSLVCGSFELAEGTNDVLANPCAVFEVLSPGTEAYDRGDKWAAYRRLASLREYVLVSQVLPRVEVYRRADDDWRYEVIEAGGRLRLEAGFELNIDAIYDGVFELPGA